MKTKRLFFSILLLFFCEHAQGQIWSDVGGGADYQVRCFYHDTAADLLYVGGGFDYLGNNNIHQIGIWDGNNWSAIGTNEHFTNSSFSGSVEAITQFNGDLIVAGLFDSVAGIRVNNIARWNGTQWNAMGNGFDALVSSLQVYSGEIYAGGDFIQSGTDTVYYVAKWNGLSWTKLLNGLNSIVNSMCLFNNNLIIGGSFTDPYSSPIRSASVIGWNNTNWISFDSGFSTSTITVKVIMDTLYAVGSFSNSHLNLHYITRWDGQSWLPTLRPSGGIQPWITDIASYMNSIYLCGYFTTPPDLVRLSASGFDSMGNAMGFIKRMIVYNSELYVAGGFSMINGLPLYNIARFRLINGEEESISTTHTMIVFPNPVSNNDLIHFRFNDLSPSHQIELYDSKGVLIDHFTLNNYVTSISVKDKLSQGIYIISIIDADKNKYSLKLIRNEIK